MRLFDGATQIRVLARRDQRVEDGEEEEDVDVEDVEVAEDVREVEDIEEVENLDEWEDILVNVTGIDVDRVRDLLAIQVPEGSFHCMCSGELKVEITSRRGVQSLTVHHGRSIRVAGWDSDAALSDGRAFLVWLGEQGVPEPLVQFDAEHRRNEQAHRRAVRDRWIAASPRAIAPYLERLEEGRTSVPPDATAYATALSALGAAYPSTLVRARALLVWYGRGEGPWSGYPAYEEVAAALLDLVGIAAVCDAVLEIHAVRRSGDLIDYPVAINDPAVMRGAARFLTRGIQARVHTQELAHVADEVWQLLGAAMKRLGHDGHHDAVLSAANAASTRPNDPER